MKTKENGVYKTKSTIKAYKKKSDKSKVVTTIPKSTNLRSLSNGNTWTLVKYNGKEGYIKNEKLTTAAANITKTYTKQLINGTVYEDSNNNINKLLKSNNMSGIYGAPYQFMANVDPRLPGTEFGVSYAEDIVADMPLLMITPGEPKFLSGFSEKDRTNIETVLKGKIGSTLSKSASKALNDLVASTGSDKRYYTFRFAYSEYYNYVNPMLWNCALYLGIGKKKVKIGDQEATLASLNWAKAYNKLKNYTNTNQFVSFYLDSENNIQESFSNSTTQSSIADAINAYADQAAELKFFQGAILGRKPVLSNKDAFNKAKQSLDDLSDRWLNGSRVIKNLGSGVLTIASGGRLLFPEVWSDSNYGKSYDISIKLRTPDCDTMSWYLNICVPLMHLIALAAPRQLDANGYTSPFLIRAFYKGLFNIDMGMIDQLSISKGKECAWTANGLPTEVDVTMSIKDLYQALFISGYKDTNFITSKLFGNDMKYIVKNTGMMDYLASTCGIDVNKIEVKRTIEMFSTLYKNGITTAPLMWGLDLQEDAQTAVNSMYRSIFGIKYN